MDALTGCGKKNRTPDLEERVCPRCGERLEVFTRNGLTAADTVCPRCGLTVEAGELFPRGEG